MEIEPMEIEQSGVDPADAAVQQRLDNDPGTELEVTAGQVREIAALRLQGLVR
ncbi:MAG: hypothetical protein JWR90_878 [Marmoricola sp.]|jgi:2-oxo-4-hydroxy-4-carboxy--5-ureidoimidazoline (OHCU) decarboxylase|nr:hypothetical protein [Marmoricola sp.]